jgi:FkbM family methyltransferase
VIDLDSYWRGVPSRRITARGRDILFDISTPMAQFRAQTLLTKEPATIRWLDRMTPEDVFYDVGANVGAYSVYASLVVGTLSYAFEPDGRNFRILCRNVDLNDLSGKLIPFCLGVSDSTGPDLLYARDGTGGESGHNIGEIDDFSYLQGIMTIRLDTFVESEGIIPPTMLKIDVDGLEPRVVEGLGDLRRFPGLKGVNIELNRTIPAHGETLKILLASGFGIDEELGFVHADGVSENVFLDRATDT